MFTAGKFKATIVSVCLAFFGAACANNASADTAPTLDPDYRSHLPPQLTFENSSSDAIPDGWNGSVGTVAVDRKIFHGGGASVRFDRDGNSKDQFSVITTSIPVDFRGSNLELRGYLKTRDVNGMVGLWMREDGTRRALQLDNMNSQHVAGTTEWTEYSIKLPLDTKASQLFFGVLLSGTGTAWADDLQLLVDGQPITAVAHIERPKSILESDREFANGSGIQIDSLSPFQIDNVVKLARVWGFLKYHHPAVTNGTRQWDFELFRILPSVLKAASANDVNALLAEWIDKLGVVPNTAQPTQLPVDPYVKPDFAWIHDETAMGAKLSNALIHIYENRNSQQQFYVELAPNVGNPQFDNELTYDNLKLPDSGYQLLALFRLWNIVEYWYPYRDLIGNDWLPTLKQAVPEFALAKNARAYKLALLKTIAHVRDTHANLWSSLTAIPPEGDCSVAASVRFIGSKAVIAKLDASLAGLQVGDVIAEIDAVPIEQLIKKWKPFYAASNDTTVLRDIGRNLLRGACGSASLAIERGTEAITVDIQRVPDASTNIAALNGSHDLSGNTFQLLTPQVAYLKLSSVKASEVPNFINAAAGTKGLIVDIRNYPSEFVVFALGQCLVTSETAFARFTKPDLNNPGAFIWGDAVKLSPAAPHYSGKVVILVDEVSLSQAEYTAMALRSAPNSIVIGSTTAGADGNVSRISLPANLSTAISGIGVFYPAKKPTQRIGIVPDIRVLTTLNDTRLAIDPLIERAKREINEDNKIH
jgi:hypothetical protein